MEHIRIIRDGSSSPHPIGNLATPLIQADPSLLAPNRRVFDAEFPASPSPPPSTADIQYTEKSRFSGLGSVRSKLADLRFWPSRSKPGLSQGFERPSFSRIAILTVLCLIVYPAFCILTLVAKDKSLFTVRLIVSAWCSCLGFALGYILLKIGARHLEAATWATVIHMSHEGGGMKLRDLARSSSNPTSFVPSFHTLQYRFRNREVSRSSRGPYDTRPWPLFLGFFAVLAILGPLLPFLFGRITEIEAFVGNRRTTYHEVLIAGDLSQEDAQWAMPAGSPYRRSTPEIAEFVHNNHTVYFAQPSLSQFVLGGSPFNQPAPIGRKDPMNDTLVLMDRNTLRNDTGTVIRYPQWGIRIHCEKLPDLEVNLVPDALGLGRIYALVPWDFLRGLFGVYGMDLRAPVNITLGDLPNTDLSKISFIMSFSNSDPGANFGTQLYLTDDQGWTTIEMVTIQLDTSSAPSGRFPVYSNKSLPGAYGIKNRIGYDAAVCVQKYEPWIIEAYNTSTGSSYALQIVERVNNGTSPSPSGNIRGSRIVNTRYLNTTGKDIAFDMAYSRGFRQVESINYNRGSDYGDYVPPPTLVSFTDGTGPLGYTELSPNRFADFRARVSAAYTLPYLVGSGLVVAQSYGNETLAYVTYKQWQLIALPVFLWILGIIGELCVPTLPLNIPRREFGVYSWLTLFLSQELQFEAASDLNKLTNLDDLEESFSNKRVKFVVEEGEI